MKWIWACGPTGRLRRSPRAARYSLYLQYIERFSGFGKKTDLVKKTWKPRQNDVIMPFGPGAKVVKVAFFSYKAHMLSFMRWPSKPSNVYFCSSFECFLDSPGGLPGGLKVTQNRVNNDYACSTFPCFWLVLIIGRGRDVSANNTIIEVLLIDFVAASKKHF